MKLTTDCFFIFKIVLLTIFCSGLFAQTAEKTESELQKRQNTLQFGLETDITALVKTLIDEEDFSFSDELFTVFNKTKNTSVREKMIEYFTVAKDSRLSEYAVKILDDPFDEKRSTVELLLKYVGELKVTDALPAMTKLIDSPGGEYRTALLSALGKIGGGPEAVVLAGYLEEEWPLPEKQALVKALGLLKAEETWETLVELAENTDQNVFMRMDAAQAIGAMQKAESVPILIKLFEDPDVNLRPAVVRGLAYFSSPESQAVILEALRDTSYRTRLEAITAIQTQEIKDAVPALVYRAKNDPENVVKFKCYEALAVLGTSEATDALIEIVKDKKMSDTARATAANVLLKHRFDSSIADITAVAAETVADDRMKNLRYAIGKELAKQTSPKLESICLTYLAHSDVSTKGTGLDMYAKNYFSGATAAVEAIAANPKDAINQRKAKRILEKNN